MAKAIIAVLLCAIFVLPLKAQHPQRLPDSPKPKVDRRVFLVGTGLLAASKAADMWSTRIMLDKGRRELDPLFGGPHPTNARLAEVGAATFAGESTVFFFTERSRHAGIRWAGRALLSLSIANHAELAACNARSSAHSHACRPLIPF